MCPVSPSGKCKDMTFSNSFAHGTLFFVELQLLSLRTPGTPRAQLGKCWGGGIKCAQNPGKRHRLGRCCSKCTKFQLCKMSKF